MVDAGEHVGQRFLITVLIADDLRVQALVNVLEVGAHVHEVARYLLRHVEDIPRLLERLGGIHDLQLALIESRELFVNALFLGQQH